jgi:deoxyhypusine monooxygenase
VLHEIVESLGHINHENSVKLLERFSDEQDVILYESCYITKKEIEWKNATENGKTEGLDMKALKTESQNPSPPFNYIKEPKYADVNYLKEILLDNQNFDLFERYRALFTLRELETEEAVEALCQAMTKENKKTCSSLLRHEIAFIIR